MMMSVFRRHLGSRICTSNPFCLMFGCIELRYCKKRSIIAVHRSVCWKMAIIWCACLIMHLLDVKSCNMIFKHHCQSVDSNVSIACVGDREIFCWLMSFVCCAVKSSNWTWNRVMKLCTSTKWSVLNIPLDSLVMFVMLFLLRTSMILWRQVALLSKHLLFPDYDQALE